MTPIVATDPNPMPQRRAPGEARRAGVMFADVSGSMMLYDLLGTAGALAAIEQCLDLVANVIRQNRGFVIKTIGDEIMACLPEPTDIWAAALESQERVAALPPVQTRNGPIARALRIGFDFGDLLEAGGDYFGDTVNVAARMTQLAKRGQIMTTRGAEEQLPKGHHFTTRRLDWVPIRGVPDGVELVELLWDTRSIAHSTLVAAASVPEKEARRNELVLRLGATEWRFDSTRSRVSLGRELSNDVIVPSHAASRSHATIERRRDRWIVTDHSSNGTFVSSSLLDGEVHLRREELILGREGRIGLGEPTKSGSPYVMTFAIRDTSY